jgi:hypothetical protein
MGSQRSVAKGWAIGVMVLLLGAIAVFTAPQSSLAVTWHPVAEASQGQQQQFVDIDSIEPMGLGHVRVSSYYVDRRSGSAQRTDYLTEYDCPQGRFRDVEVDGPVGSHSWMPVAPDPLNTAAMEYVCAIPRPSPAPLSRQE